MIDWTRTDPIKLVDGHHGYITSVDVSDSCIVTSDSKGIVKVWSMVDHAPQLALECVLEFGNKNKVSYDVIMMSLYDSLYRNVLVY